MSNPPLPEIVQYYQDFKAAIFTSSLTLGTFLFTMKTFIVQTMKKEIYDNPEYQKDILARIREGMKDEKVYGQLKNFKRLIFWTIIIAFINALLQLTLGYFETVTVTVICFTMTGISWVLAIVALILVSVNLSRMIDISETIVQNKNGKEE